MKFAVFALVMLTSTAALAKDVTIVLTDDDQKVFLSVLDIALKQGGLSNLGPVSKLVRKFQDASAVANEAPVEGTVPATKSEEKLKEKK